MSVKDLNIKTQTYCLFRDIINMKEFDPNNVKIYEKSYKNILICHITYNYERFKIRKSSVNLSYLMLNRIIGCFEEIIVNKHLTLVPPNESKDKIKNV